MSARLVCGTDPGFGQVDIVSRMSFDNGLTWGPIMDVAVGTGRTSATTNYFDTAFGDPAIVADRDSGEIIVMAVAGCTVYGNGKTTRSNPNKIAVIRSMDFGETWQEPVDVTEPVYGLFDGGNPIDAAFVGGGKIFQSRIVKVNGYHRLYAALCARPGGNRVIYSDDFGRTWLPLGGASALPAPDGDEPKCEELPDGRVVMSSRTAGGRIYNIYTYSDTGRGTGQWDKAVKSVFDGSGHRPGNNSTNGELLVIPATRNSDGHDVYLLLQSLPTGDTRSDVGIYYKELSSPGDMVVADSLASGWNGFLQVSDTTSAYSSMDLQADGRVGFIYEESFTSFGKRDNPVSTCFPSGEGQHNFDGFDNIYLALTVEQITSGAYSLRSGMDRGAFLRDYYASLISGMDIPEHSKSTIMRHVNQLGANPDTGELDRIGELLQKAQSPDR